MYDTFQIEIQKDHSEKKTRRKEGIGEGGNEGVD